MPKAKIVSNLTTDDAGILSAVWILSCNDENPIITYKSVRKRLDIPATYPIEDLISKRSELFRQGAPEWRLTEWKSLMKQGVQVPSWIKDLPQDQHLETITSIKSSDVFRSQFRINRDTDKSPIELIEWGLQHIERLRKAEIEKNEVRWKWLKEALLPMLSIIVALVAVLVTAYFQHASTEAQNSLRKEELEAQERLKKYEVSFNVRNEGYSSLMQAFEDALESARNRQIETMQEQLRKMQSAFYQIRPFLNKETQKEFKLRHQEFSHFANDVALGKQNIHLNSKDIVSYRDYFGEKVYEETFEKSRYVNAPVLWPVR